MLRSVRCVTSSYPYDDDNYYYEHVQTMLLFQPEVAKYQSKLKVVGRKMSFSKKHMCVPKVLRGHIRGTSLAHRKFLNQIIVFEIK